MGIVVKGNAIKCTLEPFNTNCNFIHDIEQAEVGDRGDVTDKRDCKIDQEMPPKHIKRRHDPADEKSAENHNQVCMKLL